jgi:hypothetical protein
MILEDDFNFSTFHTRDAGGFCHGHVDIRQGIVGKLDGKFHTGPQLTAGRRGPSGQRIDDPYFNGFLSQGPCWDYHPDN